MKKQAVISEIAVIFLMLVSAVVSLFYLPEEIPVQWDENGVSGTAGKFLVTIFPVTGVIFIILHGQKKQQKNEIPSLAVSLVLFAAQSTIILNALGYIDMLSFNYGSFQTPALLFFGIILCIFGNRIPKFAKNYYCGIKSGLAFEDSDLWTKTQRFAGKVWFVSGIALMLLPFICQKGIAFPALCIILFAIIVPRIYIRYQYKTLYVDENKAIR